MWEEIKIIIALVLTVVVSFYVVNQWNKDEPK